MLITKLQESRATMATATRIRNDKTAIQKLNARFADLDTQADSLLSLVKIISALQENSFVTKVLDTSQIKDLSDCLSCCGQRTADRSLSDSDVTSLKSAISTCRFAATTKWKEGVSLEASDVFNSLSSLLNLLPDRNSASILLHSLSTSKDNFPSSAQAVSDFRVNVAKAQSLVNSLNLSDPGVRNFIARVRMGQATLTDLNETTLQWLKDNHLTGKLKVSF